MTKKYNTPILQIVSISNNKVITTSGGVTNNSALGNVFSEGDVSYGADRFRDDDF